MSEFVQSWLLDLPSGALAIVPLLAFLEACVFVGLFVSGIFLLSAVTLLYAEGSTSLTTLALLAFMGATLGDHIGYFLGHWGAPHLWRSRWVRRQIIKRKVGYLKFRKILSWSAPLAIVVGRLSPPIRSLSPVLAGVGGVRPLIFSLADLLACGIWASLLAALAYGANQI